MNIQNLSGQKLGQYDLTELIGTGGMGAVYKGYQSSLNRYVAIKVLSQTLITDPQYLERFTREAKTYAALEKHPNIVPVYDFGTQDGVSYVVMRLLAGGSLEDRLEHSKATGRELPNLNETASVLRQVGSALHYAHEQGVFHRDIKTSNIMFDEHGTSYVVDFGIAKLAHATTDLTDASMTMGTPSYMAPEQWKGGEISQATDQYSLGIVTYSMLTGHLPFEGETVFELMQKHINESPTPLSIYRDDLPDDIREVIFKSLSKEQSDRYESVVDYVNAFTQAVTTHTPATSPTGFLITPLPQKRIDYPPAETPVDHESPTPKKPLPVPGSLNTLAMPPHRVRIGLVVLVALLVVLIGGVGILASGIVEFGLSEEDRNATETQAAILAQPSLTHTPTATSTSTSTATPTSSSTPSPSPSATLTPDVALARVRRALTLRSGPGSQYPTAGQIEAEEILEITGISEDGSWYQVLLPDGEFGWLVSSSAFVEASGPIMDVEIALAPTNTPTDTPTASPTITDTPTSTFTATDTANATDTPTPTLTASRTPSDTPTHTPSHTPSKTPRPASATPSLVPTVLQCPGTLPARLQRGDEAIVLDDDLRPLNVRAGAGLENRIIDQLNINERFIIDGIPTCEDNFTWYRIQYNDGEQIGFVAEASFDFYFIGPVEITFTPTPEPTDTAVPTLEERPNLPITPEAELMPACQRIVGDTFETGFSRNDWFLGRSTLSTIEITDGAYQISILESDNDNPVSWGTMRGYEPEGDVTIEAIMRSDTFTPDEPARLGLWLRYQNENAFLAFMLRGDGYYRVTNYRGFHLDIVPWSISEAILVGENVPNTIRIDIVGNRFDLYINGFFIRSIEDDTWEDGRIAFWGSPPEAPANFYMDFFRVCER